MAAPLPNQAASLPFLRALYEGVEDGWVTLFALNRTTGERITRWRLIADLEGLADDADALRSTCCVWFGVATRTHKLTSGLRGGEDDCGVIPGLWVDLDVAGPRHKGEHILPPSVEDARRLLADFPVYPTAIINSGGGLQAWWKFTEPLPAAEAKELLPRWGSTWAELGRRRGWHVDNVFDLARVMRLPGTDNRKLDRAVPVEILWSQWDHTISPDDIDGWLYEPTPDTAPPQERRLPYIGPERPGDAYKAVVDPAAVLEAAGWTYHHKDSDGGRHYSRPGKQHREGSSATVYADGHIIIWTDAVPALKPRRSYDSFGLYTFLNHAGDFTAATAELERQGYGSPNVDLNWAGPEGGVDGLPAAEDGLPTPIDWTDFWTHQNGPEWLVEPMIPLGRHVVLFAPTKMGKSLLALEVAAGVACGRAVLGNMPCDPIEVVYFDFEMTESDLQERLLDMGYDETTDLAHLHYYSLPSLPPLDTKEGGQMVEAIVRRHNARLVVIDTMARVIQGEENSNDTYRWFDMYTSKLMKVMGVAVLRLDHTGKDLTKGQRGASEKAGWADVVWQLNVEPGGLATLRATQKRIGWVPQLITLNRLEEPTLMHQIEAGIGFTSEEFAVARELDELGVPVGCTVKEALSALREAGRGRKTKAVSGAVKSRKVAGNASGNAISETPRGNATSDVSDTAPDLRETPRETSGNGSAARVGNLTHPVGGRDDSHVPADGDQPDLPTKRYELF